MELLPADVRIRLLEARLLQAQKKVRAIAREIRDLRQEADPDPDRDRVPVPAHG